MSVTLKIPAVAVNSNYTVEAAWITKAGLIACVIRSNRPVLNHRCGYVAVVAGTNLFNVQYDDLPGDIDVHGGLTYSYGGSYPVELSEQAWWFGYDCGHYGDTEVGGRSLDYCKQNCEDLATQLQALS